MPANPKPRRNRPGSGQATLADVAQIAGVSAITVSRALNSPDIVSLATLEAVRSAVKQVNYVPNLVAGGLASNRSNLVVAIVPTVASPMFAGTIEALEETLGRAGFQLMIGVSGYSLEKEDRLLQTVLSRRPAGVVLTGTLHSADVRARLLATKVPVVETWDLTPDPIGLVVGFSAENIGRDVARHLRDRGYRRPAILSGDDRRAVVRARGFRDEALRLGLPEPLLHTVPAPTSVGHGRAGLSELLKREPRIDAIACSSDTLALGVLLEAQARALAVPRKLGVMGFGDLNFAATAHPPLSTVAIDGAAMGRHAASFLIARSTGRRVKQRVVDVGYTLVPRAST